MSNGNLSTKYLLSSYAILYIMLCTRWFILPLTRADGVPMDDYRLHYCFAQCLILLCLNITWVVNSIPIITILVPVIHTRFSFKFVQLLIHTYMFYCSVISWLPFKIKKRKKFYIFIVFCAFVLFDRSLDA